MSTLEVFFAALGLSMDNMAAAAASGCAGKSFNLLLAAKVAAIFSLTGMLCLAVGWFGGRELERFISRWDHWVAFILLAYIGLKMIRGAFSKEPVTCMLGDSKTLITMALATNIDVLVFGVSMALFTVSLLKVMLFLVACIVTATFLGFALGRRLGDKFGKKAGILGGAVLLLLGLKILIEGLLA